MPSPSESAPDRYAVMGNPVGHSLSPRIHALFAEQTGENLTYEAICPPVDGFEGAVRAFQGDGGRGLNVTLPFKGEAHDLADACTERASRARAVNTLTCRPDGGLAGDNTDGVGLLRDLRDNQGVELEGAAVAILGAGGAVRGVLGPLLEAGPMQLVIANRTAERARELATAFADLGPVEGIGLDGLAGQRFDLLINSTSAGLSGGLPQLPDELLRPGAACYDMLYGEAAGVFLGWAREHGARLAADGLGMLVEQAAESFRVWRGTRPATPPVIAALREPSRE